MARLTERSLVCGRQQVDDTSPVIPAGMAHVASYHSAGAIRRPRVPYRRSRQMAGRTPCRAQAAATASVPRAVRAF